MRLPPEKKGQFPAEKIVLLSTPWPLFNRPSIQLGTLKAYLSRHMPQVNVKAYHFYLQIAQTIGYALYQAVSERTWTAEAVYAAMLYPHRTPQIEKLFRKYATGNPVLRTVQFTDLVDAVKKRTDKAIAAIQWNAFGLAGFSVSLCQLTSTLYFLKRVKSQYPELPTVVGGTTFSSISAHEFLEAFREIDAIVVGEGERPLRHLVERLQQRRNGTPARDSIPGLVERSPRDNFGGRLSQLDDLKDIPPPDYDDYFQLLESFAAGQRFFPTLPVEMSRGCWWKRRPSKRSSTQGCAFCNLNIQWQGYRAKGVPQVLAEIDALTSRHQVLSMAFTDNVLPAAAMGRLFQKLLHLEKDLRLFAETRATASFETLNRMKAAGMGEVQAGIEALSSGLLRKMNKGVSATDNMAFMRNCEALKIKSSANLIVEFPGSDEKDVAETLTALEYAMIFQPLKIVHFWLGLGSPVWQNPQAFNIRSVFNHPHYRKLFPEKIFKACRFMVQAYRGDLGRQKKMWQPVREKVRNWRRMYDEMHRSPFEEPLLGYRDGKSFLLIRQQRYKAEALQHRLTGVSRQIYIFCQTPRTVKRILAAFSGMTEDRLLPFLRMMKAKHLMYEDGGSYLSLAVPLARERIMR